jgi:hypothetical protein
VNETIFYVLKTYYSSESGGEREPLLLALWLADVVGLLEQFTLRFLALAEEDDVEVSSRLSSLLLCGLGCSALSVVLALVFGDDVVDESLEAGSLSESLVECGGERRENLASGFCSEISGCCGVRSTVIF